MAVSVMIPWLMSLNARQIRHNQNLKNPRQPDRYISIHIGSQYVEHQQIEIDANIQI